MGMDRWLYEIIKNVITPIVQDINKILDRVGDNSLKYAIDEVVKLETKRVYINALLYLIVTIIVSITIGVILCK